jgi:peptidoglycan/LPS O-acetylase OafA/YrhL
MKPFNDVASDFSYSLYVIHFPTIVFLTCCISGVLGLGAQLPHGFALSDPREAVLYLSTIIAAVAIAFVYARLVERQTGPTRRAIKRRFAIR